MTKLIWKSKSYLVYLKLLLIVNGTPEFGQVIRWCYLLGDITENRMTKLDKKNFKKWQKATGNSWIDYLDVARV